jgi:pilus assembly protein CpaF
VPAAFQDDQHLLRVIDRIVSGVGRRIDDSSPMVDARLPDGSRVNAIIAPLAVDGPLLSIRRFPAERLQADDLVAFKALAPNMLEFLRHCVGAKLNDLVSGGTGAGKTTLLNVLSSFISDRDHDDRSRGGLGSPGARDDSGRGRRTKQRPSASGGAGQLAVCADRIIVGEVR